MKRGLGFPGIRLQPYKSPAASSTGALNAKMLSSASIATSDSVSSGSVGNLKLAAEKLVKEQATARKDLEMANAKLKKLMEQVQILEEKLQGAFNENAKFKVKQKEDEKLWKGLESKFESTRTLCNQLYGTLQELTAQVQDAEKSKAFLEDKLSATSVALNKLHEDMKSLSLRLDSSEDTVKTREKELMDLGLAKENTEMYLRDENRKAAHLIEEKEGTMKQLEEAVAGEKRAFEGLALKMDELHLGMRIKEAELSEIRNSKEMLEKENQDLSSSKLCLSNRLDVALEEIKRLEDLIKILIVRLSELDSQSLAFSEKVVELNASFESCLKLAQHEKDLAVQCAQQKIDQMHSQCSSVTSERNSLQLHNDELHAKVIELQKEQEFVMVQHADECRLAEEKVRKLESEAETLLSKQNEMQVLISTLEDSAKTSLENSRTSEQKMKDLLMKLSETETESKGLTDRLKADILEKEEQIDVLQKEIEKGEVNLGSLEKRISEIENALEEKDQFILELKTRETQYEAQKTEIMKSLDDKESKLEEAKKQFDQMLESQQLDLSKHLKEISQRNDQAINDIRKKYEIEKQESVNLEKQKADKLMQDLEQQYEKRIAEQKEEYQTHLLRIQAEHGAMIIRIQQDQYQKELGLVTKHKEELKRIEIQAENELREKSTSLRSEHEAQLRALRCEHEDECRRLQEELDNQKAKEERQRALLQLQLNVMGGNPQEDQEVNSKKHYSISSTKRNSDSDKRNRHVHDRTEVPDKDLTFLKAAQAPALKKDIPKHSRKVTHHEYEIETSNGRVTKRKKTKSTFMFDDPRKQRKRETPKAKTPKHGTQGIKGRVPADSANIGDLFTEGSLDPYADDPYRFG